MVGLLDTLPIGRAKNRLIMHLSYKVFEVCWLDNIMPILANYSKFQDSKLASVAVQVHS